MIQNQHLCPPGSGGLVEIPGPGQRLAPEEPGQDSPPAATGLI